ncbi:MAG: hypothetical protein KDN20_16485 [Verrucomicrobiae bacterium]|nr:hypothetical protein [Verrucomicrobiae bacterium]
MATTMEVVGSALGSAKLTVLAAAIDQLIEAQTRLSEKVHQQAVAGSTASNNDAEIETLELSALAEQYGVSTDTLRKQIRDVLGDHAVIKVGKKRVIRKVVFLDFLRRLEGNTTSTWHSSAN